MSVENKIAIEVIGQQVIYEDYDYVVSLSDIEKYFFKGEEYLRKVGQLVTSQQDPEPFLEMGIIAGPKANSTYKVNNCLVDNRISPTVFDGIHHGFIIAGPQEEAQNLRSDLHINVPRIFPCMPRDIKNNGKFDKSFLFTPPDGFVLFDFESAEEVLNYLHKRTKNS